MANIVIISQLDYMDYKHKYKKYKAKYLALKEQGFEEPQIMKYSKKGYKSDKEFVKALKNVTTLDQKIKEYYTDDKITEFYNNSQFFKNSKPTFKDKVNFLLKGYDLADYEVDITPVAGYSELLDDSSLHWLWKDYFKNLLKEISNTTILSKDYISDNLKLGEIKTIIRKWLNHWESISTIFMNKYVRDKLKVLDENINLSKYGFDKLDIKGFDMDDKVSVYEIMLILSYALNGKGFIVMNSNHPLNDYFYGIIRRIKEE